MVMNEKLSLWSGLVKGLVACFRRKDKNKLPVVMEIRRFWMSEILSRYYLVR